MQKIVPEKRGSKYYVRMYGVEYEIVIETLEVKKSKSRAKKSS